MGHIKRFENVEMTITLDSEPISRIGSASIDFATCADMTVTAICDVFERTIRLLAIESVVINDQ